MNPFNQFNCPHGKLSKPYVKHLENLEKKFEKIPKNLLKNPLFY